MKRDASSAASGQPEKRGAKKRGMKDGRAFQGNLLVVDSTGERLSVALRSSGKDFVRSPSARRPHDELLFSEVEKLLRAAGLRIKDLDAVAAASGPGRFTGIRVGLTFASMLAAVLDVPVLGVSLLEALAHGALKRQPRARRACAALDGFQGEIFLQSFRRGRGSVVALSKPEWIEAARAQKRLRQAQAGERNKRQGQALLARGPAEVLDLLDCAACRLAAGPCGPAVPLYLKPASYEKKR